MNIPLFRSYRLRWVAPVAAIAGVVITWLVHLDPLQNPDSNAFMALARSLLAGTGLHYREALIPGLDLYAFRAPGYPLFLALGLALGGVGAVVALQGALTGLSAALLGAGAQRLGGSARVAWIAFALRMAWPAAWGYSGLLLTEVFYEFLNILAIWLVLEGIASRRVAWVVPAAVATTLAILCRPVGLGLAAGLGLWLLLRFRTGALVYAAVALLVFAPWPIRNWNVLHAPVPFTTNGGATAWAGTLPGEDVRPAYDWMGANVAVGEVGFDRHFRELASRNLRADPVRNGRAMLRRAFIYLGPITAREPWLWLHRFAMLGALAALCLSAARRALGLPLVIWAAQGAIMVPIMLFDRYRFPTEWCVVLAAGFGIDALAGRMGARRTAVVAAVALVACVAFSLVRARGLGAH